MNKKVNSFGGDWTVKKLEILGKYLDAYTSVFKNQTYLKLLYIDAFAGSGEIRLHQEKPGQEREKEFIAGSAARALEVDSRPFDCLVFIEQKLSRYKDLEQLRDSNPHRDIRIHKKDANVFLPERLGKIRSSKLRGVLFLDPFATQVEWATIEQIAKCQILDTWILFPTNAIARTMPRRRSPEDVDEKWATRLNVVYGGDDWKRVYKEAKLRNFFGDTTRDKGTELLIEIYKDKLKALLGDRFLKNSVTLRGPSNSPLFEFMFFTGNPSKAAIVTSHRIAEHILQGYK